MSGKKPKLFIILPDGVSLRNFAYSNFYKMGIDKGFEIWFWNNTPFDLDALGFNQLNFTKPKLHWLTSIFKTARLHIELSVFEKRYHDAIYKSYLFPLSYKGFKNKIKNLIVLLLVSLFNSETGLSKIRRIINVLEVRTSYFKHCKAVLEEHQPDFVFCTSQRNVLAIAPLLAAKKLNIPTMSFVYSWDNLPKATLDVSSDFYAVWSEYMRDEILYYHLNDIKLNLDLKFLHQDLAVCL